MLKDKKNEVWNIVEIARNKERPNVRFYIENIFDDFINSMVIEILETTKQ